MTTPDLARELMLHFADATGVVGQRPPRRYLWTDAFAVCNFLGLHARYPEEGFLELARALVDQVHRVLGRHRADDARSGWLSGLGEAEGERFPTRGGLRIGKELPERGVGEPFDARLEWERDGQYFHYLTRWMHALRRMGEVTGEGRYRRWAVELGVVAHRGFTVGDASPKRMAWKMSIDLSRPLVPSMGHHDPLDGLVTCLDLVTASPGDTGELTAAIDDFGVMVEATGSTATDDPLGIGGLLVDAHRLAVLVAGRGVARRELLLHLLDDARASLQAYAATPFLRFPAAQRLAFRELGLAIGLHAAERLPALADASLRPRVTALDRYLPLAGAIDTFWSTPAARAARTWRDHSDINTVMLAASLAPDGYLGDVTRG